MKYATKHIRQYPPHLRHCYCITSGNKKVIFCRYSLQQIGKKTQTHFDIFGVYFSISIANKIFHVTVLFLIYYCDQFMAPEIRHSRCHSLFVNKQQGIKRRKQDFDKKFVFKEVHSKEVDSRIS